MYVYRYVGELKRFKVCGDIVDSFAIGRRINLQVEVEINFRANASD